MSEASDGQLIKAGLLLAAGVAFALWQWRDLDRAKRETARRRAEQAMSPPTPAQPAPHQEPP